MRRHLLPNAVGPLLVGVSLTAAYTLLAAATLCYLGLGTPAAGAELGEHAAGVLQLRVPGLVVRASCPGACIVIVALGYVLVSEGIEVAVQRSGSAGAAAVVDAPGVTPITTGSATESMARDARTRPSTSRGDRARERTTSSSAIADLVVDFPTRGRTSAPSTASR